MRRRKAASAWRPSAVVRVQTAAAPEGDGNEGQRRPPGAEGGRQQQHRGRAPGERGAGALEQLDEAGDDEEHEDEDGGAAGEGEHQRVDADRDQLRAQGVVALELDGEALEGAGEVAAALAGADQADVEGREQPGVLGQGGGEAVAVLDPGLHRGDGGGDGAGGEAGGGIERPGEREAGREQGGEGTGHVEHLALAGAAGAGGGRGGGLIGRGDVEHEQAALLERLGQGGLARGRLAGADAAAGAVHGGVGEGRGHGYGQLRMSAASLATPTWWKTLGATGAAKMPMTTMTTRSSMRLKPRAGGRRAGTVGVIGPAGLVGARTDWVQVKGWGRGAL